MILKQLVVSCEQSTWKQVRGEPKRMKTAHKTDIGRTRIVNEDRAIVLTSPKGITLAVVADGMGGHQAGDIASQLTVETFQHELENLEDPLTSENQEEFIKMTIAKANDTVYQMSLKNQQYLGMGTTVVIAIATENEFQIAHIGDSRAYQYTNRKIVQLTEDHSLVNELVKSGEITTEAAQHHPRRNVLTRALGTEKWVEADIRKYEWNHSDILLLCSDGLSNQVHPEQIEQTLSGTEDLDTKADRLVQLALEAGGDDNITVILLANDQEDAAVQEE